MVITMSESKLYNEYKIFLERGFIDKSVPSYIENNINDKFDLRDYQEEAISFFEFYLEEDSKENQPIHLLYHMATGSGKTLIMAANIIELYKRGYRNFVFFVDSKNIIEKTKKNMVDVSSSKHLFSNDITIDGNKIDVREVDNFESVSSNSINIKFTTIQGLHTELKTPKENSTTYEELKNKELVLISDEAHHLNASTKKEERKRQTWEDTIDKLLNTNDGNVLLEYTATANLNNEDIKEKYENKIIYQYSLKQFRRDKYSKEVNVLQTDLDPMERALQAVILSQYRRKVAANNGIPGFKPVILMKSSKISESENNKDAFESLIHDLSKEDIYEIKQKAQSETINEAFEYFGENNIKMENLVREIKTEFSDDKIISVNSKQDSKEHQVLVNSLENYDNKIRVIFAVDKLNEGWDVLNLFDIVMLYDKSGSSSGPRKTTVQEAQLIGRGARYYPFQVDNGQDRFKRKYDDDTTHELRPLEELYYHSTHNPDYIHNLKKALEDKGIISENSKEVELNVKDSFKESEIWNDKIFINKKKEKTMKDLSVLTDIPDNLLLSYSLNTGASKSTSILSSDDYKSTTQEDTATNKIKLTEFGRNVLRTAVQSIDFYNFSNLTTYFQELDSIMEFVESSEFLGAVEVEVTGPEKEIQLDNLSQNQKLNICIESLQTLELIIRNNTYNHEGSTEFYEVNISDIVKDKKRKISLDENSGAERGRPIEDSNIEEVRMDLSKKDWYVYNENYGTSEEKYLIKFIDNAMETLEQKYDDVHLIRNASLFKIYRFKDGQAIEPDFILLTKKNGGDSKLLQLFIEPKGDGFIAKDEWKEDFLTSINEKYEIESIYEEDKAELIGLPFYNENMKDKFEEELANILDTDKLY